MAKQSTRFVRVSSPIPAQCMHGHGAYRAWLRHRPALNADRSCAANRPASSLRLGDSHACHAHFSGTQTISRSGRPGACITIGIHDIQEIESAGRVPGVCPGFTTIRMAEARATARGRAESISAAASTTMNTRLALRGPARGPLLRRGSVSRMTSRKRHSANPRHATRTASTAPTRFR